MVRKEAVAEVVNDDVTVIRTHSTTAPTEVNEGKRAKQLTGLTTLDILRED